MILYGRLEQYFNCRGEHILGGSGVVVIGGTVDVVTDEVLNKLLSADEVS